MPLTVSAHPVIRRFLTASLLCAVLDAGIMELLTGAGWQVHLARLSSLAVATLALYLAGRSFIFKGTGELKTAKGQPVPFGALVLAGAILNIALFARVLHVMPLPLDSFGRLTALAVGTAAGTGCLWFFISMLLPKSAPVLSRLPQASPRRLREALIWGLFALLALGTSKLTGHLSGIYAYPKLEFPMNPADPDAWLRLTQVRQWLTGGDFFDHSVPRTNAPLGGISTPWTRPMDILLSAFYALMPSRLGMDVRLILAAAWLPVTLGFATFALLAAAARLQFRHVQVMGIAALLLLTSVYDYTSPGDADHHGLLAALWCGVLLVLMSDNISKAAALVLGALLGAMLWTSPEALILAGAVFVLLGLDAVLRPARAVVPVFTALGAAGLLTGAIFVEMPASEILNRPLLDTLSIVHVTLLWFTVLGTAAMAAAFRFPLGAPARFFAACLLGALTLLAQYIVFPRFYLGPMGDADPYILQGFLPMVAEAKPLLHSTPEFASKALMIPALAIFLMGFALSMPKIRAARLRRLVILGALMVMTLVMTLLQARWGYYLQPVAAITVATLLPALATAARGDAGSWLRGAPRIARPYVVLGLAVLATSMMVRTVKGEPVPNAWCNTQLRYVLQTQQLQKHLGDKPLTIFVPEDIGGEMQFFTPYRIVASNYHREHAGLRDMARLRDAKTADAAKEIIDSRKIDALLYCPAGQKAGSFLSSLDHAKPPGWLAPVGGLAFFDVPGAKPLLFAVRK
ncbi:MAG: GtrA family protein [Alphaproteobacteria bacterium]|nr:GtrA family protein [Alphaproteobacteria bacterium]